MAGFVADRRSISLITLTFFRNKMCGEHQNRLVVFESGLTACARIQVGNEESNNKPMYSAFKEELAFHLSRFLGLSNVPTVVTSMVSSVIKGMIITSYKTY